LSRRRDGAHLSHHAQRIQLYTALHDLARDHYIGGIAPELDLLAGGGYALELASVGTTKAEVVGHLLFLGYLGPVGAAIIGEGPADPGDAVLEHLGEIRNHALDQRPGCPRLSPPRSGWIKVLYSSDMNLFLSHSSLFPTPLYLE